MDRIEAKRLLSYTTNQLWDILMGDFILVFDNGEELVTNDRDTLYSSYFWRFHREFPNTPFLPSHHVTHLLNGKVLTSKTHRQLLERIFWSTVHAYGLTKRHQRDPLVKMIYEVVNELYVEFTARTEAYMTSIDIMDFINIVDHPVMQQEFKEIVPTHAAVEKMYAAAMNLMEKSEDMEDNAVARAVRAKMVNANQVLQCVAVRGFTNEVDGYAMPTPVLSNFTLGMTTVYNIIAESRSASKSLYYAESPLQDAEYFARRLQLMTMPVERIHEVDCGSTEYIPWMVKPPVKNGEHVIYPGDLEFIVGKYYLDEESQTLKVIQKSDTHLYGKMIQMRSVLTCHHPDPHGVCEVCFGQMTLNTTEEGNLGHNCAGTMTQQTSQSVLSTKHLIVSAAAVNIMLGDSQRKYFNVGKAGNTYVFKSELKNKFPQLIISKEEAYGLTDIEIVHNIEDIAPARVCAIEYIGVNLTSSKPEPLMPICISQNGVSAVFTLEFMKYIKTHRWETNEDGNFIFDLADWDFDKPIFRIPEMEYSFSEHSHQIADIIESKMKEISDRQNPDSPVLTLTELFELVNSKLNVNIALLEVIIYAAMVKNAAEGDYGLARNSPTRTLGVSKQTLVNRSLSAAYAYEKQTVTLSDPASFFNKNRPDSIFDVFVAPRETVMFYKDKVF
jgi:hypothetical protein